MSFASCAFFFFLGVRPGESCRQPAAVLLRPLCVFVGAKGESVAVAASGSAVVAVEEKAATAILPLFSTERPFSFYLNTCTPELRSAGLFELFFQKFPLESVYQEAAARHNGKKRMMSHSQ